MDKPTAKELMGLFSDFSNTFTPDKEGFVEEFFRQHRTLQQEMFGLMFKVIEKAASGDIRPDGRNKAAIETCKKMVEGWKKEFIAELVESGWDEKKAIDQFVYHLSMCTFCNLCILSCPTDAIKMSQDFEHAVFDRTKLTKVLNKPESKLMEGVR